MTYPDHPMKRKAIENANIAIALRRENEELKKWKEGAERLLENYYKLIVDKDDRSYKIEQELKSAKAEVNRLKSIEVTNKHNG